MVKDWAFPNSLLLLAIFIPFVVAPTAPTDVIEIEDYNERPVLVEPGGEQWYHVSGTSDYLRVSANVSSYALPVDPIPGPGYVDLTQTCGLDVYGSGITLSFAWVGRLQNNALIRYYHDTGPARSPATILATDLVGTSGASGWNTQWTSASQVVYPSLGERFEDFGYVQANGVLRRCVPILGSLGILCNDTYLSVWTQVDVIGTRCR